MNFENLKNDLKAKKREARVVMGSKKGDVVLSRMGSKRGVGYAEEKICINSIDMVDDDDVDIMKDCVPVSDKGFRKLTSGLGKKIKEKREETKHAVSILKEEIKEKKLVETLNHLARRTPDRKMPDKKSPDRSLENVSVNNVEEDSFEEDEDNEKGESRFGKLRLGIGRKFKGIREEFVDIRDESLHSFNELREVYQEKAEQKKAILTSFTEEEITILRKNSPLHSKVTKQMNTMYMSKRLSIIRVSLVAARNLNLDLVKKTSSDMLYVKLSLGIERAKSKHVMAKQNPVWKEVFDLSRHSEEENVLKIYVLARGSKETTVIGEASVDLRLFAPDTARLDWVRLGEGQSGELNLELNVTAVNNGNNITGGTTVGNGSIFNKMRRTESGTSLNSIQSIASIESYSASAPIDASNDRSDDVAATADNSDADDKIKLTHSVDNAIGDESVEINPLSTACAAADTTAADTLVTAADTSVAAAAISQKIILNYEPTLKTAPAVGSLTVRVIQATGLGSSKIQGAWTPNPYIVVRLDNTYHRTMTIVKDRNPRWDKQFTFTIRDAFSSLHISLYSEKANHTPVFLGRVVVPLTKVQNKVTGTVWMMLKDEKLRKQAKGDEPKLQLEIECTVNKLRSAINAFGNKEELLIDPLKQKFERTILLANYNRIKRFVPKGSRIQKLNDEYTKILAWGSPVTTVKAFMFYMLFVYYFELWWVPVYILYHLAKTCMRQWCTRDTSNEQKNTHKSELVAKDSFKRIRSKEDVVVIKDAKKDSLEEVVDDDESDDESGEGKKSLKKSLDQLQNVLQEIQNVSGIVASSLEKVNNMFNFTSPFLTVLFGGMLAVAAMVLWVFGFRNVLLLWGINKFTKKLRDPDPVPTNEVANLILRVLDFEEVEDAKEISVKENVNNNLNIS